MLATSRRTVLAGLAAGAVVRPALADFERPTRIDTHHHFYAPEWKEADAAYAQKIGAGPPLTAQWTVDKTLDDMQKGGVEMAILSLSSIPGNWFGGDPATATRLSRACNEFAAGLIRDHPGRFALWASLPMLDIDASLAEIEHALDELKADGIGLATCYGDKWPGDPKFQPVFEELNRRKAVVYFHPLTPNCCGSTLPGVAPGVIEVPHDTTRAALSLLLSGTFARMTGIQWLFSHAGGTLPSVAGRINSFYAGDRPDKNLKLFAPNGIMAEFAKLNFDTANAAWPASIAGLLKIVPASHLTFGSDYPYFRSAATVEALGKLGLGPFDRRGIDRDNIRRILPHLKVM
ncbi:MAG TPA: amidohydrolase family protein [Stellaceae bacterium]|nr:amidohydrolase family protein [Stellaceae bacterium]